MTIAMAFQKEYEVKSFSNSLEPPPPPAYSTPHGSQIFDVDYVNWRRSITILDPTGGPLFTSAGHRCKTDLEFTDRNGRVIGTSTRSKLSSRIDVSMTGQIPFEVHNTVGVLGGSPKYTSPAFDGEEVIWKNTAMSSKIIYTLIDGKGRSIARFESNRKTKIGKLELMDEVAGAERLNEVAVVLLTLLHRKMRAIEASYYAAVV